MPGISGFQGTLSLGGTPIALIYDATIEINVAVADATCKGETFSVLVPGGGSGRLTAKRRILTTALMAAKAIDTMNGTRFTFSLNSNAAGSTTVVSGTGFISQGTLSVPSDAIDDSIEMMIDYENLVWSLPGAS